MNVKHPDRLSKADRLNYIVNRMRVRQDITPTDLAAELQVSERTIYRDLRSLEKGETLKKRYSRREGRYIVEAELTLPPLRLTPSEALAVYTAASNPAMAEDNFYARDLRTALDKIRTALEPEAAREVDALEDRVAVATMDNTPESLQRPMMERIRRAMRSNRKLGIHYWSPGSNQERILVVSPYDVRFMRRNWYLLAKSEEHNSVRTFKISRIREAEILPDRFRYPRRFSADAYFARAWEMFGGSDEEITVHVRFTAAIAPLIRDSRGRRFASMTDQDDGSLLCTAIVNNLKEISWWILSYGNAAEVIAPPELREEFTRTAQALATLYGGEPAIY